MKAELLGFTPTRVYIKESWSPIQCFKVWGHRLHTQTTNVIKTELQISPHPMFLSVRTVFVKLFALCHLRKDRTLQVTHYDLHENTAVQAYSIQLSVLRHLLLILAGAVDTLAALLKQPLALMLSSQPSTSVSKGLLEKFMLPIYSYVCKCFWTFYFASAYNLAITVWVVL